MGTAPVREDLLVVALIDGLGFKEIWRRHPFNETSDALASVRTAIAGMKDWAAGHMFGISLTVGWFSDSLYLVAQTQDGSMGPTWPQTDQDLRSCLVNVAMCLGYGLREAAQAPVPMVFRGVITVGKGFVGPDNIYLGPVFTEAADLHQRANGAFVWLSNTALKLKVTHLDDAFNARPLVRYAVPMKCGPELETLVVNPFTHVLATSDVGSAIRSGIERAMSVDRPDVEIKRSHTMRFVDYVVETEPTPVHLLHR